MADEPASGSSGLRRRHRTADGVGLDRHVYPKRIAAYCVAHGRRKFDELVGTSEVA
jgi:hypothetical protein